MIKIISEGDQIMNWDSVDELLLVDLYDYSEKHSTADVETAIEKLSDVLKKKASNAGSSSFDIYRTVTGLKFRLQNIHYLATNGTDGVAGNNPLDEVFYTSLREDYDYFHTKAWNTKFDYGCFYSGETYLQGSDVNTGISNDGSNSSSDVLSVLSQISTDSAAEHAISEQQKQEDNADVKKNVQIEEITYAEQYLLDSKEYDDILIETLDFPARIYNRLKGNKITTLGALMRCRRADLYAIKGMGRNCVEIIDKFFESNSYNSAHTSTIILAGNSEELNTSPDRAVVEYLKSKIEDLTQGDLSFLSSAQDFIDEKTLTNYERAIEELGTEATVLALTDPVGIQVIISALRYFVKETDHYSQNMSQIQTALQLIPSGRREQRVIYYIQAFAGKKEDKKTLMTICNEPNMSISEFCKAAALSDTNAFFVANRFLTWCAFDINDEIKDLEEKVFDAERTALIIKMRAEKITLEKVGKSFELTRERVRQIEAKTQRKFNAWISRHKLLQKVCALRDGDIVLTLTELEDYFGDKTAAVAYLLSNVKNPSGYRYDKITDAFIVGEVSQSERILSAIDNLPDYINAKKLDETAKRLGEELNIPDELIVRSIAESYQLTGNTYHRKRLSLSTIYSEILKRYYPDGMHVYDPDEIAGFRQHVIDEYGFTGMPENDHAVSARIVGIGILCDRGRYKARQAQYISKELASKIYAYIITRPSGVLTNTIFAEFEDELVKEGILNRYYLHGILRDLYGDELFFKRDYISKDGSSSNIYADIVRYIKNARFTVSKDELAHVFPGVTEIMFSLALGDRDIINYFGEYLHSRHLSITIQERKRLESIIKSVLSDGESHHIKDIYELVRRALPEFISRNGITISFRLFSVLSYLFDGYYQFSRPYFALNGVNIGRPFERLKELVVDSEEITVAEITDFAKDNHMIIQSTLELINSFNDTHILKDNSTLIKISMLNLEKEVVKDVEQQILEEIGEQTALIAELSCIHRFSHIEYPWNEWLIYSILLKWSSLLDVTTTSPQFKYSTPLVAPKGLLDLSRYQSFTDSNAVRVMEADNLDNIDMLISDYVLDEE